MTPSSPTHGAYFSAASGKRTDGCQGGGAGRLDLDRVPPPVDEVGERAGQIGVVVDEEHVRTRRRHVAHGDLTADARFGRTGAEI